MQHSIRRVITASRRVAIVAVGCFLLWLVLAVQLFMYVDPLSVHRTDAVIMLGGSAEERLPEARKLQQELQIPVLVLSNTETKGNAKADEACDDAAFPNAELVCFRPEGMDTRGESKAIARLIELNRWHSVSVVTSSYHVARAGLLIGQCTTAEVQVVASHPDLSPAQWLGRFVIETGGLLDVTFRPECGSAGADVRIEKKIG
ncbi:YdcF family protein [Arthrobacter pascens]|uniref:YdcF family protein n=1 Tax=Arthrobacter pascens TaxID=1677 RepID=UPI0027D80531|nr:YdcF family protein [Arthrobacter pascens]